MSSVATQKYKRSTFRAMNGQELFDAFMRLQAEYYRVNEADAELVEDIKIASAEIIDRLEMGYFLRAKIWGK